MSLVFYGDDTEFNPFRTGETWLHPRVSKRLLSDRPKVRAGASAIGGLIRTGHDKAARVLAWSRHDAAALSWQHSRPCTT
jgi:hypothetical protein